MQNLRKPVLQQRFRPTGSRKGRTNLETSLAGRPLAADVHHAARGFQKIGFADVVTCFFLFHRCADEGGDLFVIGAATHAAVEIVIEL